MSIAIGLFAFVFGAWLMKLHIVKDHHWVFTVFGVPMVMGGTHLLLEAMR